MAYSPSLSSSSKATVSEAEEPIQGWYFWTWKTEWEIDTWSYRRGWRDGWIPGDVANRSTFAFPVREEDGCVDEGFGWEAPAEVGGAACERGIRWWWGFAVVCVGLVVGGGLV